MNFKDINLLEPAYVEYDRDHRIDENNWFKIFEQNNENDMYLIGNYRIPRLKEKTDKTIIVVGNECARLDAIASFINNLWRLYYLT